MIADRRRAVHRRRIAWGALPLLMLLAGGAGGAAFPAHNGRVVDRAGLLPPAAEARLTRLSAVLEQRTGHQFAVVTVASLGERAIEAKRIIDVDILPSFREDNMARGIERGAHAIIAEVSE